MSLTVNPELYVAAHTAVLDRIDANGAGSYFNIYDSDNVLLVKFVMDYPSGSVNGTTGRLTLTASVTPDGLATGTADHAEFFDANDISLISGIPCASGTNTVAGTCVMSSLSVVIDSPVDLVSFTIG